MNMITECFFSLSQTLSFSETARQLYISQQAVSKNIAKLEEQLGFPLFFRSSRHVELTPWGMEYLKASKQYYDSCQQIRQNYGKDSQILRIATIDQPDFNIVKNTRQFYASGSDMPIEISILYDTPNTCYLRLQERKADMIVTIDRFLPDSPGLISFPVFSLEAALIVSRSNPKYHENATFADFITEPLVMGVDSDNHFATRESIVNDIQNFNLKPASILLLTNSAQAINTVSGGTGIVLGSVITISPEDQNLAVIPSGVINQIVCVWNADHCKPIVLEFAQYLKELYHSSYTQ